MRPALTVPAVVVLTGEVGSGKTGLVRAFIGAGDGRGMGTGGSSYALLQRAGRILHGDFYRLKGPGEVVHLELALMLDGIDVFFVEWGREYLAEIAEEVPLDSTITRCGWARRPGGRRSASLYQLRHDI